MELSFLAVVLVAEFKADFSFSEEFFLLDCQSLKFKTLSSGRIFGCSSFKFGQFVAHPAKLIPMSRLSKPKLR